MVKNTIEKEIVIKELPDRIEYSLQGIDVKTLDSIILTERLSVEEIKKQYNM
ncbi:hypothetical protein RRV45_15135 [Bacillus sp. DTU_2020_1000418_1_SI_GHA_SEK_038]|uniref:hypothetical protein n=1 Tax=Bacillus sp. DTU_2020_1000418_1_SI_GHA_SEK_038 TaxID=3077585 RepID=UPI0028E79D5E|nr:hypothetical protein [Bacillus sp. DTU_2020_1000418_1_SI_GHA_SEK_038]WNS74243.1 hypothetical protein RRV45_15135 [Bacillus sp. DTU_2020_1000418_1_SI_GHA_SEK_038]